MNSQAYFNYIEERINLLALRINARGRLNMLDLNIHSESFYAQLLNILYGWDLLNDNEFQQNIEAIDLVDHNKQYVVQVSSTSTREKIESSLKKKSIVNHKNNGYRFKFISISNDADNLKKITDFKNPHSIIFEPKKDIIDKNNILKRIPNLLPNDKGKLYTFIKDEFESIPNLENLDSNLAKIIKILAETDYSSDNGSINRKLPFKIDDKIIHNHIEFAKSVIEDYKVQYYSVEGKYKQFDKEGKNKSVSVWQRLRKHYAEVSREYRDSDDVFFEICKRAKSDVIDSCREIPIEEIEMSIDIIVVHAFMSCKIFKDPKDYYYAIAQ